MSDANADSRRSAPGGGERGSDPPDPAQETDLAETAHVGTGPRGERVDYEPAGAAAVCRRCGRPFADEELLALHRGHAHPGSLTAAQREAFEAAYEAETGDLREFQLKAAGLVILLYFGFLMLYAAV